MEGASTINLGPESLSFFIQTFWSCCVTVSDLPRVTRVNQLDLPVHPSSKPRSNLTQAVETVAEKRNMLPMIPQELSDLILDFLHDDVAALCSAGLVCRSWLPASRFHLFSDIKLQMDNVHHRLEVICAECSTIPPYILSLKIEGDECQFVDEALLRLPLLSNLKSLSLREIYMAILTPDVKKWLTTLLQNLTALYLNNFSVRKLLFSLYLDSFFVSSAILEQFETVDQAVDFIASAPCLEDIMFTNVGCSKDCNHSSQAIAPPLKRFRCEPDPLVINIMEWFCRCYPTPSLHTLEIIDLTMDDNIPTVCKFIRHLGSALENLTISCYDSDRNREVQSKRISDPYFIDASLITFISRPEQRNRSIPSYFSSQYLF